MKVSKHWLKELVELKVSMDEVVHLLPLRTIGTKEVTNDFIELDMKGYNRADLLSLRGVAYEVAAITDSKVKFDEGDAYLWDEKNFPKLKIEVKNMDLAPLYTLTKIEGLKVGSSPKEWVKKLADSGIRSINNIADVTNLVMVEYGQPLHAFDAGEVKDETIIVRTAKKDEAIVTLDGKKRSLNKNDLLITDSEKAVGIAGVMGGKNSEVSDSTNTILLEAAIFDPINLRKTATNLGLQSEASKRFYHGLTQKRLFQALNAVMKRYQDLGGKITGLTIVGDFPEKRKEIKLGYKKVNSLVGVDIDKKDVEKYLKSLNFEISSTSDNDWLVVAPYYRLDVEIEEDVIEEIARLYGYERIPARPLKGELPEKVDQANFDLIKKIKDALVKLGLTEVLTYPYYSTKTLNALGFDQSNLEILIKIANPISKEFEYLRQNLWPNLVETVDKNLRKGFDDIAIFEVGKIYQISNKNQVSEDYRLAIALSNGGDNPVAELFKLFEKFNTNLGLKISNQPRKEKGPDLGLFHPNRSMQLTLNGELTGGIAEVNLRVLNKYGIDKKVAILELEISRLL